MWIELGRALMLRQVFVAYHFVNSDPSSRGHLTSAIKNGKKKNSDKIASQYVRK